MGLSNFLIEGILNKNDFLDKYGGLGGLRADAEEYELFYKQFLDEFDRTIVSKLSEEELNNFVQLVEDAHRNEKHPSNKSFYTENVGNLFSKFIKDWKNIETMHSR
jgi:t-SNARE complex subunit (syntaxin)